jgi:hypothetical protein
VGDTIIHYGKRPGLPPGFGPSSESRTSHNFQLNAGIGFRLGSLPSDDTDVQTPSAKVRRSEVGAQFSSLSVTQLHHNNLGSGAGVPPLPFRDTQTQAGFGGRFTYNINPNLALETQGDFFPRDLPFFNNFRAGGRVLQGQAGVKVGKRFESFGIFAKARPGVVSFSKTGSFEGFDSQGFPIPILTVERRNYFSFDLGGVLEFYPSRRLVTRFEGGDTMIRYGRQELPLGFGTQVVVTPPETIHNFQFSAGVGFRF